MRIRRIPPTRDCNNRRGAAMVEFAVIAPLFVSLIIGTVEAGMALRMSTTLSAAAREGGRLAAMDWDGLVAEGSTPNDKVIADIRNFLSASGIPGDQVAVTITQAEGENEGQPFVLADTGNSAKLFKIHLEANYDNLTGYPSALMRGQTMTADFVMRAGRAKIVN